MTWVNIKNGINVLFVFSVTFFLISDLEDTKH